MKSDCGHDNQIFLGILQRDHQIEDSSMGVEKWSSTFYWKMFSDFLVQNP